MGLTRYGDRLTSSAVVAIAAILLTVHPTITNAQQQQQSLTSQPSPATAVTQNVTTTSLFQSTVDSIKLNVPEGWIIQDINNTGFILAAEVLQGYGILAQLCPQEQGQSMLSNVSRRNTYTGSCQHAQEEVIHIIRYPNLGARIGISFDNDIFTTIINNDTLPNAILDYHLQKLQEVGYRDIQILNSTDTTVNVDSSVGTGGNNSNSNTLTATIPAKLVEMTYSTNSAPSERSIGYFLLTATDATPRNLGMVTGYSLFYEGNSTASTTSPVEAETTSTTLSGSLAAPIPLPAPVRQVFDSFELVPAVVPTEPLTVEISSDDIREVAPATFEFEADITGGIEPHIISWDFDDDGSSGEEESGDDVVEHTFEEAGTYRVSLTVTDSIGQSASDSIEITVEEAPEVDELDEEVDEEEEVLDEEQPLAEEIVEEVIEEEEEEVIADTNATEGIEGATTAGTEEEVDEEQPEVEEEEEVEIEDNNLGSDGSIDLEEIINDYIDDLFDRLR